ncbi:MAG: bifunctional 5,10-methylenetetrahydrofolate dehydrogenase/5,10-methenyltetrahydrofolate cyclohydrolase [bacterium]
MVVSGKELSEINKNALKEKVEQAKVKYNRVPHLVVILVGNNQASLSYVTGKEKGCTYVGMKNTLIRLDESISTSELINEINKLNNDENVDGILVQLPLPKHVDEYQVLDSIDINKDVDGFHPMNTGYLWQKRESVLPCTAKGIIQLLDHANVEIEGKNVCIIGRSNIVGLPVAKLLLDRNASVRILHSKVDVSSYSKEADILIVAIGRERYVKDHMVKQGAVVIDVGINRDSNGKLCGDVDFDNVKNKTSVITKVPGGVGPMTIACLLENTYELYLRKLNK